MRRTIGLSVAVSLSLPAVGQDQGADVASVHCAMGSRTVIG
jgi:hypothetical protein